MRVQRPVGSGTTTGVGDHLGLGDILHASRMTAVLRPFRDKLAAHCVRLKEKQAEPPCAGGRTMSRTPNPQTSGVGKTLRTPPGTCGGAIPCLVRPNSSDCSLLSAGTRPHQGTTHRAKQLHEKEVMPGRYRPCGVSAGLNSQAALPREAREAILPRQWRSREVRSIVGHCGRDLNKGALAVMEQFT